MVEIPHDARVYPSCRHAIAILICIIVVMYVDNNGLRYTYDHSTGSVKADQESTIDRLLDKYGLTNCNSSKVSIRPDTDLAGLPINQCSRYMTKATKAHYEVLKHILSYLAAVKHLRLTWCASAVLKKDFKFRDFQIYSLFRGFQIYSFADTSWPMTRILARVLVVTLFSCIMLPFLGEASCLRLLRCLLPKLSSLELVFVRKRFNSVGN
jgi:hypothetical protein